MLHVEKNITFYGLYRLMYKDNAGPEEALHNWSGQLDPEHYAIKICGQPITSFYQLYHDVISLTSLEITLRLSLLLLFALQNTLM